MKSILTLPILVLSIFLGGCAQFSNRLVCTADGQDSFVVSQYMNIGISAKIQKSDLPEQCTRIAKRAP